MTDRTHLESEEYQGWPNRETWGASLIIGNLEPLYRKVQRLLDWAEADEQDELGSYQLGWLMNETFNSYLNDPDLELEIQVMIRSTVGSMWRVDWRRIAEASVA